MTSFAIPTQPQIEAAVQRMRSPEFAAYFFSRLENPHWVAALVERGLFSHPPPPFHREDGGVSFPHWPASRYLVRMVEHVPSDVALILSTVKTDNVFVVGDIVDAALAMPTSDAASLVPVIGQAALDGTLWNHFKDASDLCIHLANGGETSSALALARALFAPRPGEGEEQLSHRDEYWYKDGLKRVVPVLAGLEPQEFVQELCDWLHVLVNEEEHPPPDSGLDSSYWWRPAIEDHEQNRNSGLSSALVGFVRQGLEHAIRTSALSLGQALEIVAEYPYLIFRRIEVHLLNEFAEQDPEGARRVIMDRERFDDFMYKHEYAMLVGRRLDFLTSVEREHWFGWVDAGPEMSDFDESFREDHGQDPTEDDRALRVRFWQFNKLHCVRKHLEGQRRTFYEDMLSKHGEPELADLNSRISTGWGGSTSPITVDELSSLPFPEAVDRVSSWEPTPDRFTWHDSEGLATAFGEYVRTKPEEFSAEARTLVDRPAIHVRTFINQMVAAINAGEEIDVLAVLSLCDWVLGRPKGERTTIPDTPEALVDRDWRWTRDGISRFVQAVLEAKTEDGPKYPLNRFRKPIWGVVEALSRGSSDSDMQEEEGESDPRTHDYLNEGMNSPRGMAMQAALEYARWVANHIKEVDGQTAVVPGGFEAMPEVKKLLERQMAPENRQRATDAMLGSRAGLIYWIDKRWLEVNAGRLFCLEGLEKIPPMPHGWAAWSAFLVWVPPHIEFYRLFEKQFAYAVAQSIKVTSSDQSRQQPMDHLGEHLVILYGRGELGLDEDDAVLNLFLSRTSPEYRRHAIAFVGRILEFEKDLPQAFVDRYQALWEAYWPLAGAEDARDDPEGWLFGSWFSSGRLPADWALKRLKEVADVVSRPEPDNRVVEQLAIVASVDTTTAVHVLDRMVRSDREGWRVRMWIDSVRTILEAGMKAGGEPKRQAERLIDYLGRRGFTALGELL